MNVHLYTAKALPLTLRIYGASDYATMDPEPGKDPDFTEHGVFGMDSIGDLWALDWYFKQCQTDKGIGEFIRLGKRYRPVRWWNEGGVIDKAIGPTIRESMRTKQYYVPLEQLPSIEDKSMKLQGFHARHVAGTIHWPMHRPWVDHVIDQLCKFPGGKHDDAADVCGLIGRGVDRMFAPSLPTTPQRVMLVPFTEKWLMHGSTPDKPKVRYF